MIQTNLSKGTLKRLVLILTFAISMLALTMTSTDIASAGAKRRVSLYGQMMTVQNYFNAFGDLIPFFDELTAKVNAKVEIDTAVVNYIYGLELTKNTIEMTWNTAENWDIFEPYVGKVGGLSQEEAAALPIADEYHITFSKPISDYAFTADPDQNLVPNVFIADEFTLVISIPGGTAIGDGYDAVIHVDWAE